MSFNGMYFNMVLYSLNKRNIFKEQVTGIEAMQPQDFTLKLLNSFHQIFQSILLYELLDNCEVTEVLGNVNQMDAGFTFEG